MSKYSLFASTAPKQTSQRWVINQRQGCIPKASNWIAQEQETPQPRWISRRPLRDFSFFSCFLAKQGSRNCFQECHHYIAHTAHKFVKWCKSGNLCFRDLPCMSIYSVSNDKTNEPPKRGPNMAKWMPVWSYVMCGQHLQMCQNSAACSAEFNCAQIVLTTNLVGFLTMPNGKYTGKTPQCWNIFKGCKNDGKSSGSAFQLMTLKLYALARLHSPQSHPTRK